MNRLSYFSIFVFFLISCSHDVKKESYILTKKESKLLEYGLNTDRHLYVGYFEIYFLDSHSCIHKLRINDIKQFYDLGISKGYNELSDYIYAIFNQKLNKCDSITIKNMDVCCKIDSNIYEFYKKNDIKGIMSKYSKYDRKKGGYILYTCKSKCEFDTIAYLFFINRYFLHSSDCPYFVGFFPFDKYWGCTSRVR